MAAVPVAEGVMPQRQAAFSFGGGSGGRGPVSVTVSPTIVIDNAKGNILDQLRDGLAVVLQQALAEAGLA